MNNRFLFFLLLLITSLVACNQVDVFEKDIPVPGQKWKMGQELSGSFRISDTLSAYNIYIVLRHTDAYNYNNIWLNVGLQSPGDSMYRQKLDLSLGSDATGWEGTGMNDIWEVRKRLTGRPQRFRRAGDYRFTISQAMRDDPLEHIMSAGIRVEKAR